MNTSPTPTEIAKPCPFCGSPAKHRNNEFGDWYECSNRIGFGEGCPARKLCMTLEEWNRRPDKPEAEAVAVESPLLTFAVAFLDGWLDDAPEEAKRHWKRIKERVRSPVESVPVAEVKEICAQIHKLRTDGFVNHGSYADKELEAIETRLSAIVKENSNEPSIDAERHGAKP